MLTRRKMERKELQSDVQSVLNEIAASQNELERRTKLSITQIEEAKSSVLYYGTEARRFY